MTHSLMVSGIGEKLFLAPLSVGRVNRVLDIGTGTGIWAMEMGHLFPGAEVT
jgi:methylase of polypeptide subunit release factors